MTQIYTGMDRFTMVMKMHLIIAEIYERGLFDKQLSTEHYHLGSHQFQTVAALERLIENSTHTNKLLEKLVNEKNSESVLLSQQAREFERPQEPDGQLEAEAVSLNSPLPARCEIYSYIALPLIS